MHLNRLSEKSQSIEYITGSSYEGAYDTERQCMHGFGCYVFPNGSTYHGYFKDGLFHGFGHLELLTPFKYTIKGNFENGHLTSVMQMTFGDNLRVSVEAKNKTNLDFSQWSYCCADDRRFLKEISHGLKTEEPIAKSTRRTVAVGLTPGNYDIEEGIFNEKSGFVSSREPYFSTASFIPCTETTNWIKEHCRSGRNLSEIIEPNPENCRRILETNVKSQKWCNDIYTTPCSSALKAGHKYFTKLCNMEIEKARKTLETVQGKSENEISAELGSDVSLSSFPIPKPKETEVLERIREEPKLICDDEGSVSVNISLINLMQTLYSGQQ